MRGPDGDVPVLYCGEDLGCALAETVFHDLDDDPGVPQEVLRADLLTLRATILLARRDLLLGDLRDPALAALGRTRAEVVATPPSAYPDTRLWGQHAWEAGLDGLVWNSRRAPARASYVLFVPPVRRRTDLDAVAPPLPLFDGPGLAEVMAAASDRGVTVVLP